MGKTYDEIKIGAVTFADAARMLGVIGEAGVKQLKDETAGKLLARTMIPTIVLKAFSIELGLKALVTKNTKTIKNEHELNELYDKLSEIDKEHLKSNIIIKMQENKASYSEPDFNIDLMAISKAFVDWRYFYEDTRSIDILFLNTTFDVVMQYI